jgi:carbamoyltransferase
MLLVTYLREDKRLPQSSLDETGIMERLRCKRSDIPAVTHLDYSARVQTVNQKDNKDFHALISAFEKLTGCPMIVNTSFNVRGEPIVCTPEDAYRCFMRTEMDVLVMENCILYKEEQPFWTESKEWRDDLIFD